MTVIKLIASESVEPRPLPSVIKRLAELCHLIIRTTSVQTDAPHSILNKQILKRPQVQLAMVRWLSGLREGSEYPGIGRRSVSDRYQNGLSSLPLKTPIFSRIFLSKVAVLFLNWKSRFKNNTLLVGSR